MSENAIAFGAKVKELREARRLTAKSFSQRQFARAVGISPTFLSKIETGQSTPPSAENIKRMAELLGYSADELLRVAGRIDPEVLRLRELLERALFNWGLLDSENWDVNERADIRRSIIKE